jgi:hypothetical protein
VSAEVRGPVLDCLGTCWLQIGLGPGTGEDAVADRNFPAVVRG